MAAAASSASAGESASQSTCGVAIEAATITAPPPRSPRSAASSGNECSLIAAGHTDSASRISDERHDERQLAEPQVERLLADGLAAVAVEHGRDQPQRVHRREHDRDRTDGRVSPALREDAGEDRELAGEVRGARHGEREHPDDHHDRREDRTPLREPAELGEAVGAGALDQHRRRAGTSRRDEAVADRVQDRAVETEVVGGEDAEHDQAHLPHRRVRDRRRGCPAGGTRAASRRRARPRRARGPPCASRRPGPGSAAARSR